MGTETTETSREQLTENFARLLQSSIRFTSAATLYGVQQVEDAMTAVQKGEGLEEQAERIGRTLSEMADCLLSDMSESKRETMNSFSRATDQTVKRSWEAMKAFDPREVMRVANTMAQKSSETLSDWMSRKETARQEEPQLAADVLAS